MRNIEKGVGLVGVDWINSPYKRAMDIMVAASSLAIVIPVGATALGLSRIMDGKGALFRQQRIGQDGEKFTISKIRTLKDIGADVVNQGINDPHATRLGRTLRLLGLDEVPQVTNVLSGEMSMVGPRAGPQSSIDHMQEVLSRNDFDEWLEIIYLSKPGGISSFGLAYRLDEEGYRDFQAKARMDKKDFKNASLQHDLLLMRHAVKVGIRLLPLAFNQNRFKIQDLEPAEND